MKLFHPLFAIAALLFSAMAPAQVYDGCEPKVLQCDNCSTSTQWSSHATSNSPELPHGYSHMECSVHVVNLNTDQVKHFTVVKMQEPGLYQEWASEQSVDPAVQAEFDDFFSALNSFESSAQTITLPVQNPPVDSGYLIPYDAQARLALANYINNNHPGWDLVMGSLSGVSSVLDIAGFGFSHLLTIKVIFPDGSEGFMKVEVLGIGQSQWVPVEGTFTDADGNPIYFDADDYDGQQGTISAGGAAFLINRLSAAGWSTSTSGSGGSCSWSCSGSTCTLSCDTE
jgi:hypothetical protein